MTTKPQSNDRTARAAIEAEIAIDTQMTHVSLPMGKLTLTFANGKAITVETKEFTPEIMAQAMMHGLKQKLVDAAAISRDPATGRAASIDTKYEAVNEVATRLTLGEWNKRREGSGANAGGLLFQALCRKYDRKTPEQIKEWLDGKDDKAKAALRKNPEIAKLIDEIRAEKGDAGAASDLLAELDDEFGDDDKSDKAA